MEESSCIWVVEEAPQICSCDSRTRNDTDTHRAQVTFMVLVLCRGHVGAVMLSIVT